MGRDHHQTPVAKLGLLIDSQPELLVVPPWPGDGILALISLMNSGSDH